MFGLMPNPTVAHKGEIFVRLWDRVERNGV